MMHPTNLKHILGLKIRKYRQERNMPLKELAANAEMSISYLSEIEKGKKSPKPERILKIANALGVDYDELVSTKLDEQLNPIQTVLNSSFLQDFPFHLFGIDPESVLKVMTEVPAKAGAFARTILEIGRLYAVDVEEFFFAALRSYQQMNQNYFPEIEAEAHKFLAGRQWEHRTLDAGDLKQVLKKDYQYTVFDEPFTEYPELQRFRSVFVDADAPKLLLNPNLKPEQRAFILGREIGYNKLGITERAKTSSWHKVESFEQVLNNFKASYFSGALLMPEVIFKRDLKRFFSSKKWDAETLLLLIKKFRVTSEMFFYRMTELLPQGLGLNNLFFIRFNTHTDATRYRLSKFLNLTDAFAPKGLTLNEKYCRKWPALSLLKKMAQSEVWPNPEIVIEAKFWRFVDTEETFFVITLARSLALTENRNASVSLGIRVDKTAKESIGFLNDPSLETIDVGLTCERCPLHDCADRVVPPHLHLYSKRKKDRGKQLAEIMKLHKQS